MAGDKHTLEFSEDSDWGIIKARRVLDERGIKAMGLDG